MYELTEESLALAIANFWKENYGSWPGEYDLVRHFFGDFDVEQEDQYADRLADAVSSARSVESCRQHGVGCSPGSLRFRCTLFDLGWENDYENVIGLGCFLVDELAYHSDDLQAYYEKPWKWGAEFVAYQLLQQQPEHTP